MSLTCPSCGSERVSSGRDPGLDDATCRDCGLAFRPDEG